MDHRALILYWHGLGDVIQLTPHMRKLYKNGYSIDLMCRSAVYDSYLLDNCPYIDLLMGVENPWQSHLGFKKQSEANISMFESIRYDYDWSGKSTHKGIAGHKIDFTSYELGMELEDKSLELFIHRDVEQQALDYINTNYPEGYIFVHTHIEWHKYHNWDAKPWIKDNLPDLPVFDTQEKGILHEDINFTFVIAREAKHRVLSSSVMVHACEAMGCTMDIINYGRPDRKVWPLNQDLVLHIREGDKSIK